jgi:hypothetical protein
MDVLTPRPRVVFAEDLSEKLTGASYSHRVDSLRPISREYSFALLQSSIPFVLFVRSYLWTPLGHRPSQCFVCTYL